MTDPSPQQSGHDAGDELRLATVVLYQPTPFARRYSGTNS
jgi:hypothetical protein